MFYHLKISYICQVQCIKMPSPILVPNTIRGCKNILTVLLWRALTTCGGFDIAGVNPVKFSIL